MGQNDDAKWEDFARVFENFTIKTIAFSFLFVGFFEFFLHDNTHWYIVVLGRRKNQTLFWASFGKLHFLVGFKIPIFWQEIIFKSLAFELKFSKIFNFFYHDITSWYIVVCLKRINWRLCWTSFGKLLYWDLVVFLEFLRKKTSHAISWIFAITNLRTSQLVSIRSPRRGEQLTPSRGESN